MSDDVLIQRSVGSVLVIQMNRPTSRNALNRAMLDALADALEQLPGKQSSVRAVVLTGSGGSFCSGADLKAAMVEDPDLIELVCLFERRQRRFHNGFVHVPERGAEWGCRHVNDARLARQGCLQQLCFLRA